MSGWDSLINVRSKHLVFSFFKFNSNQEFFNQIKAFLFPNTDALKEVILSTFYLGAMTSTDYVKLLKLFCPLPCITIKHVLNQS